MIEDKPVMRDTDRELKVPLVLNLLKGDASVWLVPPILLRREPFVQRLGELIELGQRCGPSNLHGQVLSGFATTAAVGTDITAGELRM
jgi:hypothetical protein